MEIDDDNNDADTCWTFDDYKQKAEFDWELGLPMFDEEKKEKVDTVIEQMNLSNYIHSTHYVGASSGQRNFEEEKQEQSNNQKLKDTWNSINIIARFALNVGLTLCFEYVDCISGKFGPVKGNKLGSQFTNASEIKQKEWKAQRLFMHVAYPWIEEHVLAKLGYAPDITQELQRLQRQGIEYIRCIKIPCFAVKL